MVRIVSSFAGSLSARVATIKMSLDDENKAFKLTASLSLPVDGVSGYI
jgi:hypothetical protein